MSELFMLVAVVFVVLVFIELNAIKRSLRDLESGLRELRHKLPWPAEPRVASPPPEAPRNVPVPFPPPVPPPVPRPSVSAPEPAPAEESARTILQRIWSWIIVGEEHRAPGVSLEFAVATTWLIRAGIVALVTCTGYFLKWSIDRNLMGPEMRVALSALFGVVLVVLGSRMLARPWRILGQGLLGGGIAVLYFSVYAAGPLYELVPRTVAFGLMCAITLAVGVLAVRQDSLLVAILGLVGGYGTPVLLKTETTHLPVLYGYLALLGFGVLWVALSKPWRLLNYLGFLCTFALFLGTLPSDPAPQAPLILMALTIFFLQHAALVYLHNLRRGQRATLLEIFYLTINAALTGGWTCWIIRDVWGRPYPALATLALALFFAAQAWLFLRSKSRDESLVAVLLALAALFSAATLPLALAGATMTLGASLLALAFLWMGLRLEQPVLRHAGHVLYGLALARLVLLDLPDRYSSRARASTLADYARQLWEHAWIFGTSFGALLSAFFLERSHARRHPSSAWIHQLLGYGALALLFVLVTLEGRSGLRSFLPEFLAGGTSLLWAMFAVALVVGGLRGRVRGLRLAGLGLFLIVVGKVFLVDLSDMPTLYRVLAFMVVGLFLLGGALAYLRAASAFREDQPPTRPSAQS